MIKTLETPWINNYAKIILFSAGIAFGLGAILGSHFAIFAGIVSIWAAVYEFILKPKTATIVPDSELEEMYKDLNERGSTIEEQQVVITEYEAILDEQIVDIPCNCGKSMFKGILLPKTENICICPSCECTYKVMVSYDSIQVADIGGDSD